MNQCIAYVAGSFPARSETFVYREVRTLRARGWAVRCVSLNKPAEPGLKEFIDLESGLTVVYGHGSFRRSFAELLSHPLGGFATLCTAILDTLLPGEPLGLPARAKLIPQAFFALGIARELRRRDVQHVHAHFAHAPATVAMYTAKQLKVPFSFTGHANDIFQRRTLLKRKLQRASFVSCISEWHRGFYQSIDPQSHAKLQTVRCGVDVNGWSGARPSISADKLRVLTVCRLVEKKGIDTLIRALAALKDRDWQLTVAGDGPDRKHLEMLAKESGVNDRVKWLGAVANDDVPKLLAEADVFALPCRHDARGDRDGIPVVLMEAMACRVPVISGDLPAIRELVKDRESGFLVSDEKHLTDRLKLLAGDPDLRKRIAEQGRKRVEEEFSLDLNVARLENAIRNT